MPQATVTDPDLKFLKEVKACGGDALKKCFQCASCSTVCNLSPDDRPFPRKEMIWAQWGLKNKLSRDPDIWLCHQCNDCSKYCPRGAKPGDVLAALRHLNIREYAFPRFLAFMVNDPKFLPVIFAIPVILLLVLMAGAGTLRIPDGEIVFRKFIPQWPVVDVLFPLTAIWTVVCAGVGARRLWTGFRQGPYAELPLSDFSLKQVGPTIWNILGHRYFKECVVNSGRYLSHFPIFLGFVLLLVTTTCVAAGVYVFHQQTPYSLYNPIKWIGNVGAIVLILGALLAVFNRLAQQEEFGKGTYFDWLFLVVVLATGLTGLLTEILRLADIAGAAYPVYFAHLVFVWFLFAYLPFSKFAHVLYRTTALLYARSAGRELKRSSMVTSLPLSKLDFD